jgi:hypothetical protein
VLAQRRRQIGKPISMALTHWRLSRRESAPP